MDNQKQILFLLILVFLIALPIYVLAQDTTATIMDSVSVLPLPPTDFYVKDMPNDDGTGFVITWKASPSENVEVYEVYRKSLKTNKDTLLVAAFAYNKADFEITDIDEGFYNDTDGYIYSVRAITKDGRASVFVRSDVVIAKNEWFNKSKEEITNLIAIFVFMGSLLFYILKARTGIEFKIRPIAGINDIDSAIGRATEMGKPILYVPGLSGLSDVATIAGLMILSDVAKKAAQFDTPIIVPVADYLVFPVAQAIVKEAYIAAGRPDAFREESVFFLTSSQFAYVAGVSGIMSRQKPATNFFLGMFWAESLILTERGNQEGCIQIAGTDAGAQLPFFITTCDYTLIGEELYAAGAYISRDAKLLATIKAQDFGKLLIVLSVIIGTILTTVGFTQFAALFPNQ